MKIKNLVSVIASNKYDLNYRLDCERVHEFSFINHAEGLALVDDLIVLGYMSGDWDGVFPPINECNSSSVYTMKKIWPKLKAEKISKKEFYVKQIHFNKNPHLCYSAGIMESNVLMEFV